MIKYKTWGEVMSKIKTCFLLILFILALACGSPAPSDYDSTAIDPSVEPAQESPENSKPIIIERKGWRFEITPKASYSVQGEVLSKKNYYSGTPAIISPCDIALVFGELYTSTFYKDISWSQSGRWYWWKYGASFPKQDDRYIARWSSNNHIIPASDNLKKAAKSVSEGDLVVLEGYLVSVDAKKGDDTFFWNSSLSRSDTGDGSCEVLYLEKIKIGENVYE
jgi:hypothetical protein